MKLKNATKKFSVECETAKSFLKHGLGLAFSGKRRNMLFLMRSKRRWEFWMLGMRYELKIIFIDKNKKVAEIQKAAPLSLNPKTWKIYKPKKPCRFVLELGKDINKKFEVGDKLMW